MIGVFQKKTSTLMTLVNKLLFIVFLIIITSCEERKEKTFVINGYTQGTTYSIKYHTKKNIITKEYVDSLLDIFDLSMSAYVPNSTISKINNNIDVSLDSLIFFVLSKSIDFCYQTSGMFDVTVSPIVSDWGFGPSRKRKDLDNFDNSLYQVGCDKIRLEGNKLIKQPLVKIDLNGIAQGYTVDYLADHFKYHDIFDFMIEVGGEVICSGNNLGNQWKIGVDAPHDSKKKFAYILKLTDMALATSGSYRNFYYLDSTKISHTINPKTMLPVRNNLISATILYKDCISADAYATTCMSFGLDSAKQFLSNNNILGSLIYLDGADTLYYFSEGFSSFLHKSPGSAPQ